MLDINRVLKEDRLLRALTGLNRQAFNELTEKLWLKASSFKRIKSGQGMTPFGAGLQERVSSPYPIDQEKKNFPLTQSYPF